MLRTICEQNTALGSPDIKKLEEIAKQLPLMAEIQGADMFIDCMSLSGKAIVVAQARPAGMPGVYKQDIVGQYAEREKEPAVFRAFELQTTSRDIRAITQEDQTVEQNTVPIFGENGNCIAVLISEKDASNRVMKEKKLAELSKSFQSEDASLRSYRHPDSDTLTMRETHHRIKNNLQMVASILNLQARRVKDEATKDILKENVGRVLSIASIHDILAVKDGEMGKVDSLILMDKLSKNLRMLIPVGKQINIEISGDSVLISPGKASSVALVINELATNAIEHAFNDRSEGSIEINFAEGEMFNTVTVSDNGCGFVPFTGGDSLGLKIVEMTVNDRLGGHFRINSNENGTSAAFDYKP